MSEHPPEGLGPSHSPDGPADAIGDDVTGDFVRHLGLELTEIGPDRVEARWSGAPHLQQPYGIVHGGVHCSVIETLASVGAAMWFGDRGKTVGVNNNTDFIRAVTDEDITSVALPVHRTEFEQIWVVESRDDSQRLVAQGRVRLQNLYPRDQ